VAGNARLVPFPRWERRLLGFLEATGVGRVVESEEHEEERRATRLDGWIVGERVAEGFLLYFLLFAQRCAGRRGASLHKPLLRSERRKTRPKQINKLVPFCNIK
jgi:hypothetical protein